MTKQHVMSHSQKELYKLCKRKWYYQYEQGIEEDKSKSEALVFGSYVHAILEQYMREYYQFFSNSLINENDLRRSASTALSSLDDKKLLSGGMILLGFDLALQGLSVLQKDYQILYTLNGEPAIEIAITVDKVYTGIIDLIYVDKKGQIVLLDWKTTSWGGGYTNHRIKQSKQLKGYAWLVKKKLGRHVDIVSYGVLDKKIQTAHIMKVKNTRDYKEFESELKRINSDVRLYRGGSENSFQCNEENCFAYRSECLFYPLCWSQDQRFVETIDLVPSLG